MAEKGVEERSIFQKKYDEFVEDLMGAIPEYVSLLEKAKQLSDGERLTRFQQEVKVENTFGSGEVEEVEKNPGVVLPGVKMEEGVWSGLSSVSKKAIWEHVRILSICCFMEAGFGDQSSTKPPAWMEDAMNDLKKKMEGVDFEGMIKKFMNFFQSTGKGEETDNGVPNIPGIEKLFENGFPKIPEKFLKGHMAKLAQEIVKEITPEDLGLTKDIMEQAEKNPSRAFEILFATLGNSPDIIQKTIKKIGNRLQQKIVSGSIRPQEIAREAEELMKEFANNTNFVDMLGSIKSTFGFEDMDLARASGKEGSARLSIARERLRKKMEQKKQAQQSSTSQDTSKQSGKNAGKK
jgi:hypothetical protein